MSKRIIIFLMVSACILSSFALCANAKEIPEQYPYRGEFGGLVSLYAEQGEEPVLDGVISDNEKWGDNGESYAHPTAAYLDKTNMHPFWTYRSGVITTMNVYFLYSDEGLYIAADIYDPTTLVSDGIDDVDPLQEGITENNFGYNGDTFILSLDPLGTLYNNGKADGYAPNYCISYFEGDVFKMFRTRYDTADITEQVEGAVKTNPSEKKWCFEALIPWDIIIDDIKTACGVELTNAQLTANCAESTLNVIYMDRCSWNYEGGKYNGYQKIYHIQYEDGITFNVSRSISVCTVIPGTDILGVESSGTQVKTHGIRLMNSRPCTGAHTEGAPVVVKEPGCESTGSNYIYCSVCGMYIRRVGTRATGHTPGTWTVLTQAQTFEPGREIRKCTVCNKVLEGRDYILSGDEWQNPFDDTEEQAWYYDPVRFMCASGLMQGVSETRFAQSDKMTRAMFTLVMGKMYGIDTSLYQESDFNDVPSGQWYTPYVAWAAEKGLVSGTGNGAFEPNAPISREQMACIMLKYTKLAGKTAFYSIDALGRFDDADEISGYAVNAMKWAVTNGVINGMTDSILSPKTTATRGQVCAIIRTYIQNPQEYNGTDPVL